MVCVLLKFGCLKIEILSLEHNYNKYLIQFKKRLFKGKNIKKPNEFYKYASSNTTKIILETSKIRWSSPLLFNDLNEFQQYPIFSPTIEESWVYLLNKICDLIYDKIPFNPSVNAPNLDLMINSIQALKEVGKTRKYILSKFSTPSIKLDDIKKRLRESMENKNLNTFRILCLTSDFDNEQMWGLYSDNHFGCILSFKSVEELDSVFLEAKEVDYIDGERIVGSGLDVILNNNMNDIIKKTNQSICFTKKKKWFYEKEWRLMTKRPHSNKNYDDFIYYPEELESVTFEVRTTDKDKNEIKKIISEKYPETVIYQMYYENGKLIRR